MEFSHGVYVKYVDMVMATLDMVYGGKEEVESGVFSMEHVLDPGTGKNLVHFLGSALGKVSEIYKENLAKGRSEDGQRLRTIATKLCSAMDRSSVKYTISTLYAATFEIYLDQEEISKAAKQRVVEDTVYIIDDLIQGIYSKVEEQAKAGNQDSEQTLERIRKVILKAVGYLAEVYLENKEYEKARSSIEFCFGLCEEKSDEELNSFIALFKYYLKLDRGEDVLNLINTIVEHPKLDSEGIAIILSITLKYKKYEEGSLFGRNVFKMNSDKKLLNSANERERCIILFLDNVRCLLQKKDNSSSLAQGIILYVQNSLNDILKLSEMTVDTLKCIWDI